MGYDVVSCHGKGTIPAVCPVGWGFVRVVVLETLQPRRWGIFWMRHCEKSRSLVCGSVMAVDMVVMHVWMSTVGSWVW